MVKRIMYDNGEGNKPAATDFDLVIVDEAYGDACPAHDADLRSTPIPIPWGRETTTACRRATFSHHSWL